MYIQSNSSIMKVLVAVKRVVDYTVKIRVKPDKSGEFPYQDTAFGVCLTWALL